MPLGVQSREGNSQEVGKWLEREAIAIVRGRNGKEEGNGWNDWGRRGILEKEWNDWGKSGMTGEGVE